MVVITTCSLQYGVDNHHHDEQRDEQRDGDDLHVAVRGLGSSDQVCDDERSVDVILVLADWPVLDPAHAYGAALVGLGPLHPLIF